MNTSYKGKNLQVLIGGKSIALATSHQLTITANTVDTTTKDDVALWQKAEIGTMTWQLTSDNVCSHGTDGHDTEAIMTAFTAGTAVTVIFGLVQPIDAAVPTGGFTVNSTAADKIAYTGSALLTSVTLNAPNGERATMSITLTGTGALTAVAAQNNGD